MDIDAKLQEEFLGIAGCRHKAQRISRLQDKGAIRNDGIPAAFHCTDQNLGIQLSGQILQRGIVQNGTGRNDKLQQLSPSARKGFNLDGRGEAQKPCYFFRRRIFRVYRHGEPQLFLDVSDLFAVDRIPDPGNRIAVADLSGKQAAQKILFIRIRDSDQKIRILYARLPQNGIAGAVADHAEHIELLGHILHNPGVHINHGNVMGFTGETLDNRLSNLSASNHDNTHCLLSSS